MTANIVTKEDLDQFEENLLKIIKETLLCQSKTKTDWLKSNQAREIFDISPATLQKWRINGIIAYSKIGNSFYYRAEDIERLFEGKGKGN